MIPETRIGRISFVGAGPGAADLITVRGARRIAEADIVIWSASVVTPECVREHVRADAELVDSTQLAHEQAVEIYRRAERDRLNVVRVHSGDPSLWGSVQEQYDACARMEVEAEIVPGVAAFSAAAASAGHELTGREQSQSVVLTRLEGGSSPVPDREKVREFARHGTTMALFLSAARATQLAEELRAGGYGDDVPVLIAYKVSWPDELVVRTTLGELEATVKQHKLWRNTLFVIGNVLRGSGSRPRYAQSGSGHAAEGYSPQARGYRRSEAKARRSSAEDLRGRADSRSAGRGGAYWNRGSGAAVGEGETVPEPRSEERRAGQPDSDIAWWAVREWQESARAPRIAASRVARPASGPDQPDLFVVDGDGEDGKQAPEVTSEAVEAETAAAASESHVVEQAAPGAEEPVAAQAPSAEALSAGEGSAEKGATEKGSAEEGPAEAERAEAAADASTGAASSEAVSGKQSAGPSRTSAAARETSTAKASAKAPKSSSRTRAKQPSRTTKTSASRSGSTQRTSSSGQRKQSESAKGKQADDG